MQLRLEAIQFNHDATLETTGAFNIRRDETQTVTVPEWQFGRCYDPDCSPAAYAISAVPKTITVKARFSCTDLSLTRVEVRALDGNQKIEAPPGFRVVNVLGDVGKREVILKNGQSADEIFKLKNARIHEAGVSASDNIWLWQFSLDSKNWTDFQLTKHRIYTVIQIPTCPWEPKSTDPSNIHLPWTEVLEYACHWAAGLTGPDIATAAVTKRVYDLGKTLVTYQDGSSYANEKFELTPFLALLKSGIGKQTLDCDDCATIVSTFANILGCELSQSGMGLGFGTNQILLIGKSYWNSTNFLHHTVAWKGMCSENDILFDACLQVDGDGRPGLPPQAPIQPTEIRFGSPREQAYQFCLAKAGSCAPIPGHPVYGRRRRQLGKSYFGEGEITDTALLTLLKRHYSFEKWPGQNSKVWSGASLSNDFPDDLVFQDWHRHSCERLQNEKFTKIYRMLFKRHEKPSELVSIELYECAESESPNSFLLQLLARFEQFNISRLEDPMVGDLAFVEDGGIAVLFRRARLVAVVRSAGRQSLSVVEVAVTLDQYLTRHFVRRDLDSILTSSIDTSVSQQLDARHLSFLPNINRINLEEEPMHRLAYRWTNFGVNNLVIPPVFFLDGVMDLTNLQEDGTLTNGTYEEPSGHPRPITGKVNDFGDLTILELNRTDGLMRWEGLLVYDYLGKMIIAGKRFTPQFVKERPNAFDQVQDPWIITKP